MLSFWPVTKYTLMVAMPARPGHLRSCYRQLAAVGPGPTNQHSSAMSVMGLMPGSALDTHPRVCGEQTTGETGIAPEFTPAVNRS
jgi:hypothetical protein